ncbi:ATP-grasp domain-containing protein [Chengkuizengella axinellae]|uniref:ATP-grasp domain-containing protein n=1 Tax=Chengkuizengella axinellae TaxID=3064388 RepID=A0ABT9IZR6_9BACL|nr:ATP-grasp domain-containing protein [Chengkuizengella sp. 2205SS18-9]MDP5274852.1 ATP-grasp domain-containing protein [Chengkuizengella sp. 2205SS18-9]
MSNKILFIETNTTGTGSEAMKIAKEKGYEVHFWTSDFDQYKTMEDNHPQKLADESLVIDTYDVDKMKEFIKKNHLNYSGILAFDDYHLIPAAVLAEHLHLPGHQIPSLEKVRNKRKMRDHIRKNKFKQISQPKYSVVSSMEDIEKMSLKYPCVIKPVDDSGSNGVTICKSEEQLRNSLRKEMKREINERGYQLEKEWLIEELIVGKEFSAEMIFSNSKWNLISITEKETYGSHSVECGHVTGSLNIPVNNLQDKLANLLHLFELDFGSAHIEFFIDENDVYLVEINPRLAGDCIPELVEISTGVNMIEHVVNQSIAIDIGIQNKKRKYASIQFALPLTSGKYVAVKEKRRIKNMAGFIRMSINKLPYHSTNIRSSYNRLGYIITKGDSKEEAQKKAKEAINLLEWSVVNG